MKIVCMLFLIVVLPLTGWASEGNPYGVSVEELVERGMAEDDGIYMSLAPKRCAAFIDLVNGVLQRDTGKAPFDGQVDTFLAVSMSIETIKAKERGAGDDSINGIGERVFEDYARHRENYLAWMTYNYDYYGDYWGTDPKMAAELQYCKTLIEVFEG